MAGFHYCPQCGRFHEQGTACCTGALPTTTAPLSYGGPQEQPCGKVHFVCEECSRVRLRQILEQAKKHEPMVPLWLFDAAVEAIKAYVDADRDGTEEDVEAAGDAMDAAIRAAREGAR